MLKRHNEHIQWNFSLRRARWKWNCKVVEKPSKITTERNNLFKPTYFSVTRKTKLPELKIPKFSDISITYSGSTISLEVFNTLLHFRLFKVALSGVSHWDVRLQCILWWNNKYGNITTHKLNTVICWTNPATFLTIRVMQKLSVDEANVFSLRWWWLNLWRWLYWLSN